MTSNYSSKEGERVRLIDNLAAGLFNQRGSNRID